MLSFSSPPDSPIILAIAGGSCSGKTTFAAILRDYIGPNNCHIIRQDAYYIDIRERGSSPLVNFDIPDALDFTLLLENLQALKRNEPVVLPRYDFTTHQRQSASAPLTAKPVIIVEGILLLTDPKLREIFDHSVYMRCDTELRLSRRLERDTRQRGRTRDDVLRQFHTQVEPAHHDFVRPSDIHADLVIEQADYMSNITHVTHSVMARITDKIETPDVS